MFYNFDKFKNNKVERPLIVRKPRLKHRIVSPPEINYKEEVLEPVNIEPPQIPEILEPVNIEPPQIPETNKILIHIGKNMLKLKMSQNS